MARGFVRARIGLAGASAALAILAALTAARADVVPVRIDYRAPPGCKNQAAFQRAVGALTPNARAPDAATPARRFTVAIERAGAELVGRLRIEEIDGFGAEREVRGSTCDDVVAALALVTALAIDAGPIDAPVPLPSATVAPSASAAIPPAPSASAPPAPSASAPPAPSASAPPTPSAIPPLPPTGSASASVEPPPPPPPSPWATRFAIGALGNAIGAASPSIAWGGAIFIDWSGWGPTAFTPSLRMALSIAESFPVDAGGGRASFRLATVRFEMSPWVLGVGPVEVRPCVGVALGGITGTSLLARARQSETKTWADLTLGPRVQWRVGERWVIEGAGGLLFPLIRYPFTFDDPDTLTRTMIHQVPSVSGSGTVGIAWLLP